jgi:hypothetical protein
VVQVDLFLAAIFGIIVVNITLFTHWLLKRSDVDTTKDMYKRRSFMETDSGWEVTISVSSIIKYGIVIIAIVGLWFLPNLIQIRDEYRPYDETFVLYSNYEKKWTVNRSWETDLRLTGKIQSTGPIQFSVVDNDNYLYLINGGDFENLYKLEVFPGNLTYIEVKIPRNHSEYYMIFENPTTEPIQVTYDAGIIFERAFQGISYMVWITRSAIFALIALTVISSVFDIRYEFL